MRIEGFGVWGLGLLRVQGEGLGSWGLWFVQI